MGIPGAQIGNEHCETWLVPKGSEVGDVLRQHCIVNGHHNSSFLAMGMLLEESKYQVLDLRTQLDQLKPNTLHLVPQLAGAVDSQAPVVHGSRRGSAHRGSSSTVAEGKGAKSKRTREEGQDNAAKKSKITE